MSKPSSLAVLSSLAIFEALSKSELRKVAALSTPSRIRAGQEFITEGSSGREAFIITSGRGTVRRGNRLVAGVGPGDIVGEMALFAGLNRTASVTADTDLEVEVLTRTEFMSLLDQVPAITKKLMTSAFKRIHELEEVVPGSVEVRW